MLKLIQLSKKIFERFWLEFLAEIEQKFQVSKKYTKGPMWLKILY